MDIIPAGSEIVCDYEISDGGSLAMSAYVPCLETEYVKQGKIDELRRIIFELFEIMKNVSDDDRQLSVNIIKG